MNASETHSKLDSAWKSACKVLLGQEIGELAEFREYLMDMVPPPSCHKSAASGKEVHSSRRCYCENANFARNEELSYNKPFALNINELKDLDTLLPAIAPQVQYVGDKNLGVCANLEKADSCTDCINIFDCHQVLNSENVAYSYSIRKAKYVFGCDWCGEISFMLRTHGTFKSTRCFETYLGMNSSDLGFSFNCRNCSEMLFCFNQVSKRHMVGNLELPKGKYLALKKKLLGEISSSLSKDKTHPSLFELIGGANP